MATRLLKLDDLCEIRTPEHIATLFKKLGYDASSQSFNIDDLNFSPATASSIIKAYLIASQENADLQVFLFELHPNQWTSNATITARMNAIAKSLCQRPSLFLILATKDYKKLRLISPVQRFNAQMELQVKILQVELSLDNPSFSDLHLLEKIAVQNYTFRQLYDIQQRAIAFAQSSYNKQNKFNENPVSSYLKAIGKIRLLNAEEEILLARQSAKLQEFTEAKTILNDFLGRQPDDFELAAALNISLSKLYTEISLGYIARNKLIESNLKLVISIAKRYQNRGLDFLDLIQQGNLGLIRATEKFDPTKGYKFSTYATWWIRQGIIRAIHNCSRTIRLPAYLWKSYGEIRQVSQQLIKQGIAKPSVQTIAARFGKQTEHILTITQYFNPLISWDLLLGENLDNTFEEIVSDDRETPEEKLIKTLMQEDINKALDFLLPREADVLKQRNGFGDKQPKSLEQIGRQYNLTRERIRQIEANALNKLRIKCAHFLEGYIGQKTQELKEDRLNQDNRKISESKQQPQSTVLELSSSITNQSLTEISNLSKLQTIAAKNLSLGEINNQSKS